MAARETNGANAWETTLTADFDPTALTATVSTTANGPTSPCYVVFEPTDDQQREIVYMDGVFTGTTFVTTSIGNRYLTGSAAASGLTHRAGTKVRFSPVWQHFEDINDRVDAVAAGALTVVNAAGDLVYGTANDTVARLGIGTARQQLATNAGATAPEWVASLQSLLTAQGDIIYASAANTPARLAKGTAAQVLTMNAGATAPAWATPSSGSSLPSARAERTAGNITLNSTTLVDVDTGTDLTLTGVVAGDVVEVSASGFWGSEATAGILDCKSVTGGNFWSGGRSFGVMAWHGTASEGGAFGGTVQRAVVAGDLSAGTLVIRFQHKTSTAVNKSFVGDTTTVFQVSAKNLRQ